MGQLDQDASPLLPDACLTNSSASSKLVEHQFSLTGDEIQYLFIQSNWFF